ncbi:MAG: RNA polymerase sigma factor [Pseudomonadota bacterium]
MFNRVRYDAHYREHYRRVRGLCAYLLGTEQDADDAAQEVFARGLKAFAKFRRGDDFTPWINTIARNHCVDRLRDRQRWARILSEATDADDLEDPAESPVGRLISAHTATAVEQALRSLPDPYRLSLVLAYYGDASYDDIAETLETTRNHVGVLLLRAKQRLRSALESQEAIA